MSSTERKKGQQAVDGFSRSSIMKMDPLRVTMLVLQRKTTPRPIEYITPKRFPPVAKIDTINVLLSVAANKDQLLYQIYVKNALLHGKLIEEVYMKAPLGFLQDYTLGEACRLKKALYGLKQYSRTQYGRFTATMKKFGYFS